MPPRPSTGARRGAWSRRTAGRSTWTCRSRISITSLPTEYGPPGGGFLLAEHEGRFVGCVGVRRLNETDGEINRLYVVPAARAHGTGRALAEGIIALARELGYRRLRLDTLPTMQAAQALYSSLGFRPTSPYRFNPVAGTSYLELEL